MDQLSDKHRSALIDLAATALTFIMKGGCNEEEEEEEENSPSQCALYRENKCKYQDATFKLPRKQNWIGCCYPSCNLWYHAQYLSLHFSSDQTREAYNLICPKHKEIRKHFQNKLTALASDTHALEGETLHLHLLTKQLR